MSRARTSGGVAAGRVLVQHRLVGRANNLPRNSEITGHLEDGQVVVIEEGNGHAETDQASLQAMCDAYGPKYDYPITPASDGVYDTNGHSGPAQHVATLDAFRRDQHTGSPTMGTV